MLVNLNPKSVEMSLWFLSKGDTINVILRFDWNWEIGKPIRNLLQ